MDQKTIQPKDSCELAAMLRQLPSEDRLRVEGVIVGIELARNTKQNEQEQKRESIQ